VGRHGQAGLEGVRGVNLHCQQIETYSSDLEDAMPVGLQAGGFQVTHHIRVV